MSLNLEDHHKENLNILIKKPIEVLKDCCQVAFLSIKKGFNLKTCMLLAKKYKLDINITQNIVESLIKLITECCKMKLNEQNFQEVIQPIGFSEAQLKTIFTLYKSNQDELISNLPESDIQFPEYCDLNWRFELQVGSRSMLQQQIPLVTMDLSLKNQDKNGQIEHIALQTDPKNLQHLLKELDLAVQESRSQHIRNSAKMTN